MAARWWTSSRSIEITAEKSEPTLDFLRSTLRAILWLAMTLLIVLWAWLRTSRRGTLFVIRVLQLKYVLSILTKQKSGETVMLVPRKQKKTPLKERLRLVDEPTIDPWCDVAEIMFFITNRHVSPGWFMIDEFQRADLGLGIPVELLCANGDTRRWGRPVRIGQGVDFRWRLPLDAFITYGNVPTAGPVLDVFERTDLRRNVSISAIIRTNFDFIALWRPPEFPSLKPSRNVYRKKCFFNVPSCYSYHWRSFCRFSVVSHWKRRDHLWWAFSRWLLCS